MLNDLWVEIQATVGYVAYVYGGAADKAFRDHVLGDADARRANAAMRKGELAKGPFPPYPGDPKSRGAIYHCGECYKEMRRIPFWKDHRPLCCECEKQRVLETEKG